MNTIKDYILSTVNYFYKCNGYSPNELWLGLLEEKELDDYINYYAGFSKKTEGIIIEKRHKKNEFMGLKIRYTDLPTHLSVDYNPHYQ